MPHDSAPNNYAGGANAFPREKLELLHVLSADLHQTTTLEDASAAFWIPQSLEQQLRQHAAPVVTNVRDLAVDFWPSDESADDINAFFDRRRTSKHGDEGDPNVCN